MPCGPDTSLSWQFDADETAGERNDSKIVIAEIYKPGTILSLLLNPFDPQQPLHEVASIIDPIVQKTKPRHEDIK